MFYTKYVLLKNKYTDSDWCFIFSPNVYDGELEDANLVYVPTENQRKEAEQLLVDKNYSILGFGYEKFDNIGKANRYLDKVDIIFFNDDFWKIVHEKDSNLGVISKYAKGVRINKCYS